ncbi:MAG TPA: HAMP domain-containing methyl-accepting chemotaxis protein [Bacilli bacterium]|nr:HAMP domain-containing methyl-accepting chemotaxis protein [Bacilli bacterium]
MKISTLLKLTGTITILLSALTVGSLFLLEQSFNDQIDTRERQIEFKQLGLDLENASNYLTNEARAYVQFGDKSHYDNYWKEVNETKTRDRVVKRLKELHAPQAELDLIETAKQNSDALVKTEEAAMNAVEAGDFDKARQLMFDENYESNKDIITAPVKKFQQLMNDRAQKETEAAIAKTQTLMVYIHTFVAITLLSTMVTFFLLFRKLKPLTRLTQVADSVARGDLSVDNINVRDKQKDEIATLSRSVNGMVDNLRGLIYQVNDTAMQVASSSEELLASAESTAQSTEQITSTIQEMASGAETQVHSAEESLVSMNEMAVGIQRIAETSSTVSETSLETAEQAERGNQSIQRAVIQMGSIRDASDSTASVIRLLDERSKEIGQIVEAITGIANQTNLLALNAAIEAARAGEHGRGFAVVADEVRKLAEQSEQSAAQISTLILEIQQETSQAVISMDRSSEEVDAGLTLVNEAGEAFQMIVAAAQVVADQIQDISASSQQMSAGSQQVTATVEELTRIARNSAGHSQQVAASTEEQLALMEEINASCSQLADMAQELQDSVGRFQI